MKVLQLRIQNFRGVSDASISFEAKTLLVGQNNVGKTTVLEALDLALGPNRAPRMDAINEHDFHRTRYTPQPASEYPERTYRSKEQGNQLNHDALRLQEEGPEIYIEVVLGDMDDGLLSRFRNHVEPWDFATGEPMSPEALEDATPSQEQYVLRIGLRGWYSPEDDEFKTQSFFLAPPTEHGEPPTVSRTQKRRIGFLYLRALRTARRAASMQRGSLLDILLELREARPRVWESILSSLQSLGASLADDAGFQKVLADLESRLARFLPRQANQPARSALQVSRLTREHLRDLMVYFLESGFDDHQLPYSSLGAGTSNVLVLALLSAIADAKENVIFAMEEPEIAVPPYTQKRIVRELFSLANQVILTSHSPYVAEAFLDEEILLLQSSEGGVLEGRSVQEFSPLPSKRLRKDFRQRYAEGLMARAVLVVEGDTEYLAFPEASAVLDETKGTAYLDLDYLGAVVVQGQGNTDLDRTAAFYKNLDLRTYCLIDTTRPELRDKLQESCHHLFEIPYAGFEKLLSTEVPLGAIGRFASSVKDRADYPTKVPIPAAAASGEELREWLYTLLKARKGDGYAALLVRTLPVVDLPHSLVGPLVRIFCELSGLKIPANDPLAATVLAIEPGWVESATDDSDDTKE